MITASTQQYPQLSSRDVLLHAGRGCVVFSAYLLDFPVLLMPSASTHCDSFQAVAVSTKLSDTESKEYAILILEG